MKCDICGQKECCKALEETHIPWQPITTAPKDGTSILAYCNHEADPFHEESEGRGDGESPRLTVYAAHAEGFDHAPTGIHIVEWGGGWHDGAEDGGASMPDWWFVSGTEFEVPANPAHWMPLPSPPEDAE